MKIIFDSQIFGLQRVGGISRYVIELVRELNQINGLDASIFAPLHVNELLKASGMNYRGMFFQPHGALRPGVCRRIDTAVSALYETLGRYDVLHATYYLKHRRPKWGRPLVVTVHDMIHERFPQIFSPDDPTARLKKSSLNVADHLICVSEATRRDLLDICAIDPARTTVIHHGVRLPSPSSVPQVPAHSRPFLLYVGQRGGYKNFRLLLEAYVSAPRLRADFDVVVFGGGAFSDFENGLMAELGLPQGTITLYAGGDDKLAALYQSAAVFVYPSLYEGFGMPILEAMAHGCPVVAAKTSSIPEAAGDAAEYFDPESSESLKEALMSVLYVTSRRDFFVNAGHNRAKEFSWRKSAQATLNVYRQLMR